MLCLTASTTSTTNFLSNTHQQLFRCQFCTGHLKSRKKINIITFGDGSQKMHGPLFKKIPQVVLPFFFSPPAFQDIHLLVNGASVRTHQGRTLSFMTVVWRVIFSDQLSLLSSTNSPPPCFFRCKMFFGFLAFG